MKRIQTGRHLKTHYEFLALWLMLTKWRNLWRQIMSAGPVFLSDNVHLGNYVQYVKQHSTRNYHCRTAGNRKPGSWNQTVLTKPGTSPSVWRNSPQTGHSLKHNRTTAQGTRLLSTRNWKPHSCIIIISGYNWIYAYLVWFAKGRVYCPFLQYSSQLPVARSNSAVTNSTLRSLQCRQARVFYGSISTTEVRFIIRFTAYIAGVSFRYDRQIQTSWNSAGNV